jgi:hypothetical protein
MHTSLVTRLAPYALALAALVAACSDSVDPAAEGEGRVIVRLTDAPFLTDSVRSVNMYVVRVEARRTQADSAAADSDTDDGSKGGWKTLAMPNASIDLLTLRNGAATTLGEATLDAGTYNGLRFIIDPSRSNVVLKNGTTLEGPDEIKFPSGDRSGIKVNLAEPLRVVGGSTTTLLIDFDVNESFVMRGNSIERNGLLFKPVVKATVIDAATVNASIRLFNATGTSLNLLQAGTALAGGGNIATGASSSCSSVNAATPNLTVTQGMSTAALPGFAPSLTAGTSYTIVAYPGTGGAVQFATLGNAFTAPTGQAGLRVFNATATGYDVHVTSVGAPLASPLVSNQLAGTSSSYVAVPAGTSVVTVTSAGGTRAVVALPTQTFVAGQNATLVIAPAAAGSTTPQLFVVPSC